MNKKILGTLTLLMLLPSFSYAQNDDFGLDLGVGAEKKLVKGVSLDAELGVRTQDNTQKVERLSAGLGLGVKLYSSASKKFDLKASAGWEYIWQNKLGSTENKFDDGGNSKGYNVTKHYWQPRHRTTLGLGASYKPNKRWSFSLKESVRYNHYNAVDSVNFKYRFNDDDEAYLKSISSKDARDRFELRSKAEAQYDIRNSHFAPFVSVDYGCGLNYTGHKWKLSGGTDYKLSKTDKLTIYYRFQTENDDDEPNGHIIGLGYNHKF